MGWWRTKFDFWIPLISEKNDKGEFKRASLGRVAFWMVLILAMYVWMFTTGDIQPSHLQMLYITATYNLMKKATFLGNVSSKDGGSQITIQHEAEKPPRV